MLRNSNIQKNQKKYHSSDDEFLSRSIKNVLLNKAQHNQINFVFSFRFCVPYILVNLYHLSQQKNLLSAVFHCILVTNFHTEH